MTPVTQASAFFWSVLLSTIFIISWIQRSFYVFAHNEGRVFICRLFQRSYYDEYSSLENTIQWTYPPFLVGSPLSFLFIFCTDCTVMSAFRSVLHSLVLSPDLQNIKWIATPFETYLSYLSSTIWLMRWSERGLFHPVSHPASFRFPNSEYVGFLFVRWIHFLILWSFKISDAVIHHYHCVLNCGTYSIVTVLLRNQLFRVAFTYLSSSFCPPNDYRSGCSKNMGETGGCLPSWSHPAKLLFEAAPLRRVLWELSGNSNLSPLVSKLV